MDVCGYGHGIITGLLSTKGVIRTDKVIRVIR